MAEFALILVSTVLVNNFVLVKFLGLCPFMGVSRKLETAMGMGLATTFVLTLSSVCSYLANEFLLPAIACIIVGGTAITGGVGSIWRTFIGALIIAVVRIGMTFIGVSIFAQQIVFGVVLVAAVAATIDRTRIGVVK